MALLADENKNDWNNLIEWKLSKEIKFDSRQDRVPDGLRAEYTVSELTQFEILSNSEFNAFKHYDYNQYLSRLLLLAHSVDTDFQTAIKKLFKIDSVTNIGNIGHLKTAKDEEVKEQQNDKLEYIRSSVPSLLSAQKTVDCLYSNAAYPVTANLCDLNKCSLVFDDIGSLLNALNFFVVKVRENNVGNIVGLIGEKNGF